MRIPPSDHPRPKSPATRAPARAHTAFIGLGLASARTALIGLGLAVASALGPGQGPGHGIGPAYLLESPRALSAPLVQTPPRNDDLASAITLRPAPFTDLQDTRTATREAGETIASCDDPSERERGVWYVYEAAADGLLAMTTTGSTIDTVLSAWVVPEGGEVAHPLLEIACNDGVFAEVTSALVLAVRAGEPVYVKVAGFAGEAGRIQLHVVPPPGAPLNDDRAAAKTVPSLPFEDSLWTVTATDEPDEPRSACAPDDDAPERGVWYRVTMPAEGAYVTAGADAPAILSAWSSEGDGTVELACATGRLALDGEAGEAVLVKVSAPGAVVPVRIYFDTLPPPPGNDDLAAAEGLALLPVERFVDTWIATDEPDEVRASCADPDGPEHGVWYRYTAPDAGVIIADGRFPGLDLGPTASVISAWRGDVGHPLEEIACARSDGGVDEIGVPDHLELSLAVGEVIHLKLGAAPAGGFAVLNLVAIPPNDDLAGAIVVTSLPFAAAVPLRFSSLEPGEAEPSCAGSAEVEGGGLPGSLWYRLDLAAGAGVVVSSTLVSPFTLSLWSADDAATPAHPLREIACAARDAGGPLTLVAPLADPGPTWLRVSPSDRNAIDGLLTIFAPGSAPDNDARADAELVTSLPFSTTVFTFAAGDDADEPRPSCAPSEGPERGVWYRYTPSTAMQLTVAAYGSTHPVVLSAWEAAPGAPPHELACATPGAGPWPALRLDAEPGKEILIKAAGVRGAVGALLLTIAPTPANDDLADAVRIVAVPFRDARPIDGATEEPFEAHAACGEREGAARGVWYHLVVPADGEIHIDTAGSDYDTVLSLWSGDAHPLMMLDCNDDDDELDTLTSVLTRSARAGETVWIKVGGFMGSVGNLALYVGPPPPPPPPPVNDDLAAAIDASRPGFTSRVDAAGAGFEVDELGSECGVEGEQSVWYRFTAVGDGPVVFDTFGSDFDTVLSAWRGDAHPLEEIDCNDDDPVLGTLTSRLELDLVAGETIYLKVSPLGGRAGEVVFSRDGERIYMPMLVRNR